MKSSDVFLALMVAAGVCTPAWSQDDRRGVRGDPNSSTSAETSTAGGAQPDPLGGYDDPYVKGSLESPYMTSAPESNGPYGYEEGAGSNSYDPYQPLHQYPQFGEPFGRAPGGAAAASNSAAESAPNPAGFGAALSAGLDGFNSNPAEPNPLGASQLGLPVQMGDHQQGSGHASETPDWSRDDQGDLQGDPYRSSSSASALGTNSPFDPKSLTKRYQTYNKRPGEGREFNPYASDAPQADGDNGEGDEAYPDGLANPYDSNVRSRGYGGSVATYGHSLDSPRRAATGPLKHNDQFGRRSDGLTTYTYDPCATVNPYEHDGDPCGASAQADSFRDYDNPYSSRSLENPYVARTTGNYGQYGYSGVTVSNPYDPYRLPHGNQSL